MFGEMRRAAAKSSNMLGSMELREKRSAEEYSGPPQGGERKTASAWR